MLLAIAAGGALGAPARYGVAQLAPVTPGSFPWATFVENLSGAFLLGVVVTILVDVAAPGRLLRPFLGIGFLGSYTTFSALAVETSVLLKDGHIVLGIGYTLATVVAGLMAAFLGIVVARVIPGERTRI